MIVHKYYNKWSPSPPKPQRKSKRVTEKQKERQTAAVRLEEKASRQQKLNEKKKLEGRNESGKAKAATANPMAIPSMKIKIAGEGLRLLDGKKVPGDIASKKMAAPQTTAANNLLASGGSAKNSSADLFK